VAELPVGLQKDREKGKNMVLKKKKTMQREGGADGCPIKGKKKGRAQMNRWRALP